MDKEREEKFVGIVLSGKHLNEADSRIEVLSAAGKLFCTLKGVRRQKAKLKFASMPFCVAEFVVVGTKYKRVITATSIETFYDLTASPDKFYAACSICGIAARCCRFGTDTSRQFLLLTKVLKNMCYSSTCRVSNNIIYFLINILQISGYGLDFGKCNLCGNTLGSARYLNSAMEAVVCNACKGVGSVEIDADIYNVLRLFYNTELNKIDSIKFKEDQFRRVIVFLNSIYLQRFEGEDLLKGYLEIVGG